MKWIAATLAAFALAGTTAGITANAAIAAPKTTHVVGDACIGADIGRRDVDPSGKPVICDSNYTWQPYVGQVPSHGW